MKDLENWKNRIPVAPDDGKEQDVILLENILKQTEEEIGELQGRIGELRELIDAPSDGAGSLRRWHDELTQKENLLTTLFNKRKDAEGRLRTRSRA